MMRKTETGVQIELTDEQFTTLLLALGTAAGSAMRNGNAGLIRSFLRLANAVNEGNPKWRPYEVPSVQSPDDQQESKKGAQGGQS